MRNASENRYHRTCKAIVFTKAFATCCLARVHCMTTSSYPHEYVVVPNATNRSPLYSLRIGIIFSHNSASHPGVPMRGLAVKFISAG